MCNGHIHLCIAIIVNLLSEVRLDHSEFRCVVNYNIKKRKERKKERNEDSYSCLFKSWHLSKPHYIIG